MKNRHTKLLRFTLQLPSSKSEKKVCVCVCLDITTTPPKMKPEHEGQRKINGTMTTGPYTIEPLYIIDGDTIKANVQLGFGVTITRRLRIAHVDAQPINTLQGQVAMATLAWLLNQAQEITAEYIEDDKWGRAIVNLYITPTQPHNPNFPQSTEPDGRVNAATVLLGKKLAKPYEP